MIMLKATIAFELIIFRPFLTSRIIVAKHNIKLTIGERIHPSTIAALLITSGNTTEEYLSTRQMMKNTFKINATFCKN